MGASAFSLLIAFLAGLAFLYRLSKLFRSPAPTKAPPARSSTPNTNASTGIRSTTKELQSHLSQSSISIAKEPDFPANWLAGKPIFDLERRALFSKEWLPLSHTSHFPTAGSYQSLTIASYPLILIRGKDGRIRGFHNVCRHRAYPVTAREFGCSTVLRCRYHGWSYNAVGALVSAPHFGDVGGFEKGENGLFEIRVWVEGGSGGVWGCLEVGGDERMGEVEVGKTVTGVIRAGCVWVGGSALEGGFNWKLGLSKTRLMTSLGLNNHYQQQDSSYLQPLLCLNSSHQQQQPEPAHLFPNTFLYTIPSSQCWLSIRFLPISENKTSIRYDLYSYKTSNEHSAEKLLKSVGEKVKSLIRELEDDYQELTNDNAESNLPTLNTETAEIQSRILSILQAHTKLEKAQGAEIYPARREPRMNTRYEQAEQREFTPAIRLVGYRDKMKKGTRSGWLIRLFIL
ncbi:hypothetical protein BJX64DRAFT_291972 [Aspergillus heterothallicus]